MVGERCGERLGESRERRLPAGVAGLVGRRPQRRVARHVHDPPAAALDHARDDGAAEVVGPAEARRHVRPPVVGPHLPERAERPERAGVVDEHADRTESFPGRRDRLADRLGVRHVGDEVERGAAASLHELARLAQPCGRAGEERNAEAVLGERERRGAPDPAARAGDESDVHALSPGARGGRARSSVAERRPAGNGFPDESGIDDERQHRGRSIDPLDVLRARVGSAPEPRNSSICRTRSGSSAATRSKLSRRDAPIPSSDQTMIAAVAKAVVYRNGRRPCHSPSTARGSCADGTKPSRPERGPRT